MKLDDSDKEVGTFIQLAFPFTFGIFVGLIVFLSKEWASIEWAKQGVANVGAWVAGISTTLAAIATAFAAHSSSRAASAAEKSVIQWKKEARYSHLIDKAALCSTQLDRTMMMFLRAKEAIRFTEAMKLLRAKEFEDSSQDQEPITQMLQPLFTNTGLLPPPILASVLKLSRDYINNEQRVELDFALSDLTLGINFVREKIQNQESPWNDPKFISLQLENLIKITTFLRAYLDLCLISESPLEWKEAYDEYVNHRREYPSSLHEAIKKKTRD